MLDTQIGPYRIIREMAQGGIGQSYEAVDQTRNKKFILVDLRAETITPDILSRLYSEAKTLAVLNHPNLARMFGFIRREDHVYLVTEFVEGQTLENVLKEQGKLQFASALGFMHQVLSGVAFAHGLGVIHGDLKPANILVTKLRPLKILNFALAHIVGKRDAFGCREGNLRYVSPEQIEGELPDVRSDIYSMGMIFYELIVGKSPFHVYGPSDDCSGNGPGQFIPAPPSLVVAGLPKWLDDFILRMLATYPSDRFQSVNAAARALELGITRTVESAASERRLGRRRRAVFQPLAKRFVSGGGARYLEAINNTLSAVAKFPARQARVVANSANARATPSLSALDRVFRRVSAEFNFRWNPKPRLEPFKRSLAEGIKGGWRRHAQIMSLLLLISVEGFYFRGANIFSLMEGRVRSGPSLSEAVDSMFAQIDREVSRNDRRAIEKGEATISAGRSSNATTKKSPVAVVESQIPNRRLPLLEKTTAPAPIRVRSEPPQKLVDTRPPASSLSANLKREKTAPALHMSNLEEPDIAAPVGAARSNSPKSELNIKWEN